MPIRAWRNDYDGFAFSNSWTFDATERAALRNALQDNSTTGGKLDA
jgi:hypothetical protein